MEIKKLEKCDYVMFPRLQEQGVESRHVEREAFHAELKHVEGPQAGLVHRPAETARVRAWRPELHQCSGRLQP